MIDNFPIMRKALLIQCGALSSGNRTSTVQTVEFCIRPTETVVRDKNHGH